MTVELLQWIVLVIVAVASIKMWITLEAMARSTHQIQYIDPLQMNGAAEGGNLGDGLSDKEKEQLSADPFDDFEEEEPVN